jgi:ATP-dependent Lhr-like helicase
MKAFAEQLLKRHGILTRDAVAFEEVPGGFSAVYPVLRALEEAGRIRRGYFVAGLGGLQFADPGALDRLRARREPDPDTAQAVVLAASDPANPYGAALAWPRNEEARLARAAGLHVVLADGVVVAVLSRGARQVTAVLPGEGPSRSRLAAAAARALRHWCETTSRAALGWAVGEGPSLAESPLAPFLAEAGFVRSGPGFRLAGSPATVPAAEDPHLDEDER